MIGNRPDSVAHGVSVCPPSPAPRSTSSPLVRPRYSTPPFKWSRRQPLTERGIGSRMIKVDLCSFRSNGSNFINSRVLNGSNIVETWLWSGRIVWSKVDPFYDHTKQPAKNDDRGTWSLDRIDPTLSTFVFWTDLIWSKPDCGLIEWFDQTSTHFMIIHNSRHRPRYLITEDLWSRDIRRSSSIMITLDI